MKPIEEQITENMTESLAVIRLNAGNSFDATASEGEAQGNTMLPADIIIRSDSAMPLNNGALGRDHWQKRYFVEAAVSVSDDHADDTDERAATRLAAEIYKAVMDDYQRGGLALNTKFVKTDYGHIGDRFGCIVQFDVHFWTLRDDPFNQ